ncbi:MAG: HlyD family efflux transporter periplasmic adaptor subunit [Prolixibacteraceae bacterium]|jgi:multidrug resistance efflux pump|nr:HlyD family efflux transporter periplasmic adaptor subunit [Prolixibacteraceae bacterium]
MEKHPNIELRSDEVKEILGTPPRWIIRRGITIIFSVIVVLLIGSYFYKYPDIIKARVVVLSENPPAHIVANASGKIDHLFVADNQPVEKDSLLGIIENPSDFRHVYLLMEVLDSVKPFFDHPERFSELNFDREYNLGEYQGYYSTFTYQWREYCTFLGFNMYDQRKESLVKQRNDYWRYLDRLKRRMEVLIEEMEMGELQLRRDSSLHSKSVLSDIDLEKSRSAFLKHRYNYENALVDLSSTQIQVNKVNQQIQELDIEKMEAGKRLLATLKERYENLYNQLLAWEKAFVLKTPISGQVTFTKVWSANQYVTAGSVVFSVVPESQEQIIGKAVMPVTGAGKVKAGQRVNIKFDNYPYMEYGMVYGQVKSVSLVPSNETYIAEITVPQDLQTNYHIALDFSQELQGTAEIVTDELRLLQRIFNPIKSLFRERMLD